MILGIEQEGGVRVILEIGLEGRGVYDKLLRFLYVQIKQELGYVLYKSLKVVRLFPSRLPFCVV